ncbi:hypothetical protein BC830DRAFT_758970 [Chytriomyces sp. MP71]|nr:hypothetical protein BC830DRAFT_758970 [Chytriomyces sp. MP71]
MLGVRSQPLGRRSSTLDRDTRTAPARQDEFEIIQRLSMLRHQLNEHRLACEALEAAINCETDLDEMEALHAQLRSEEDAFNATLAEMYRWKEVVENQRGSASASTAAAAESHGARHSVVSIAVTEQADVVHDLTSMAPQIQYPDPFPMSPAQTSSQSLPRPSTPVSLVGQCTLTPEDIKGVLMNRHHRSNGNVTPASDRAVAPEQPIVSSFAYQHATSRRDAA